MILAATAKQGSSLRFKGVKKERACIYRNGVSATFKDALKRAFPIAFHQIDSKWVEKFLSEHHSQTPFLWQMPYEFCQYMAEVDHGIAHLDDLLLFEWIEIEVDMMANETMPAPEPGYVALNPEHRLLHLDYPVHKMIDDVGNHKGDYFVLVFRNREKEAEFIELSPFCTVILETINHEPGCPETVLSQIADAHKNLDKSHVMRYGREFIDEMCNQAVLIRGE